MNMTRRIHLGVIVLFVAGVVVQVFLAGLGVFEDPARFEIHATWGYLLEMVTLAMLALAVVGRLGRRQTVYAIALFAMFNLQTIFVLVRADQPLVAALHPLNGFGILLLGVVAAREAWFARNGLVDARQGRAAREVEA